MSRRVPVKWIVRILSAALLTAALYVAVCVLVPDFTPPMITHFPTLADALADGMRERGWMPGFYPQSAHEIHEEHDTDLGTSMGTFRYAPADESYLVDSGVRMTGRCTLHVPPKPESIHWPVPLEGEVACKELEAAGFVVTRRIDASTSGHRRHFVVLVRPETRVVAYWTDRVETRRRCGASADGG